MKYIMFGLVALLVLCGIYVNAKTLLTCDGDVIQGAYKYVCLESDK